MNDFSAALNNFQAVQRRVSEKEKESIARARAGSRLSVSGFPRGRCYPSWMQCHNLSEVSHLVESKTLSMTFSYCYVNLAGLSYSLDN